MRRLSVPAANVVMAGLLCLASASAWARTVRFVDLAPVDAEAWLGGDSDVTVEFRSGDRLPLELKASGDLLATAGDGAAVLKVQRTFFVRREDGAVLLSLDGATFSPWSDMVSGFLRASATSDDGRRVDRLQVEAEARLKAP